MTRSRLPFARFETVEEPSVNLTPLIDVVFVILIMFIVIAPLLELDRVELAESSLDPHHESISVQESSPVSIHVHKDNSIWIHNRPVTYVELIEQLKIARATYPQATPQVFHDKHAFFGTYQSIKNASEAAGYSQIDIILKPS